MRYRSTAHYVSIILKLNKRWLVTQILTTFIIFIFIIWNKQALIISKNYLVDSWKFLYSLIHLKKVYYQLFKSTILTKEFPETKQSQIFLFSTNLWFKFLCDIDIISFTYTNEIPIFCTLQMLHFDSK